MKANSFLVDRQALVCSGLKYCCHFSYEREKFVFKLFILLSVVVLSLTACRDNDIQLEKVNTGAPYDPGKPVTFDSFVPATGRIREKVVIKGSNFGNDPSKVQVFFMDATSDRRATVIGVAGETIYCLAPRQDVGDNSIKVVIDGGEPITIPSTFTYYATEMVSTLARDVTSGTDEGPLSSVNFKFSEGIGYIGNESMIIFDVEASRVRLVSVPDNAVITLQSQIRAGKPTVTKDLSRVYVATIGEPHTLYMYSKEGGWAPSRLGELGKLSSEAEDFIGSVTLSDDEEWLYFCSTKGVFGRFGVQTKQLEIINPRINIQTSYANMGSDYWAEERISSLMYHPMQNCFYLSVTAAYSIYKIDLQGNASLFAGLPTRSAITDGYLAECSFVMPHGMTLDADGNIYVTDGSRAAGHCIRKISINTGYVSTVAGRKVTGLPDINSLTDGADPLQAVFRLPTDICFDGAGAFYILDGWGRRLRKFATE